MKKISYEKLVNLIEEMPIRMKKWDVVCLIIGYKKNVTEQDFENIRKLYEDNFIDN